MFIFNSKVESWIFSRERFLKKNFNPDEEKIFVHSLTRTCFGRARKPRMFVFISDVGTCIYLSLTLGTAKLKD